MGLVGIRITDLYMGFVEGSLCGHSQKSPQAPLVNQWIVLQFLKLFLCQVLKGTMAPATGLAEVVLLDTFVNGEGDGKK